MHERYPTPIRLGFFLERREVTCSMYPSVPYSGVDRLPNEGAYDDPQPRLWDEYAEAEESGDLNSDLTTARRLSARFSRAGVRLDIVYAEVALIPRDIDAYPGGELWSQMLDFVLSHRSAVHERVTQRPENLTFLGFDISHPVPTFHSAVYQPGLHRVRPDYPSYLNKWGLFTDRDTAMPFLDAANTMDYGPLPFCLLGVWEPR